MNKLQYRQYQQYLRRLPLAEPFKICRICIQETVKLISCSDSEWSGILSLYEKITKLKVATATENRYFVCIECTTMLREFDEFIDMVNNSDTFWKNYLKDAPTIEKQTVDDPLSVIKDGNTEEEMCLESQPLQADIVFLQSSAVEEILDDEIKLENHASDIKLEAVDSIDAVDEEFYELLDVEYGNEEDRHEEERPEEDRPCPKKRKRNIIRNSCVICDKEFVSKFTYQRHIAMHERHYNCAHCGMPFKTKDTLLEHLQEIHSDGVATHPYKSICTKCGHRVLSSKNSLRIHVRQSHCPEKEIQCPVCNKTFTNQNKFSSHKFMHREKRFKCSQCPKSFISQHMLNMHAVKHSNFRPYVCEICGIGTKSRESLRRHIAGVHEMRKQKAYKPDRSIKCTLCDEAFAKLTVAKVHFFTTHTENPKTSWKRFRALCCCTCFLRFESIDELHEHYSQYSSNHDKPYLYLNRNVKNDYTKFIRVRQIDRPYECDICKNTFKTPDSLKGHMKKHSKKPRPFKCEICGATHPRSNDLRLHIQRAHTGERPFNCSECDYRCLTQFELNGHNKWRHSNK